MFREKVKTYFSDEQLAEDPKYWIFKYLDAYPTETMQRIEKYGAISGVVDSILSALGIIIGWEGIGTSMTVVETMDQLIRNLEDYEG